MWRTRDGGATWAESNDGLPGRAWLGVYREGAAWDGLDPAGVYFGTAAGSLYVSPSEGADWVEAARDLPPILSVEVAECPAP